jgi:hypothetical protein
MSRDLPRTPIHTFGETLRPEPADYVPAYPPARSSRRFWIGLAIGCVVPVAFSAALVSMHLFPDFWSFTR